MLLLRTLPPIIGAAESLLYSIRFRTQAYRDHFHGKLVKFKNGFFSGFVFNVIPKTNTKVWHGCW